MFEYFKTTLSNAVFIKPHLSKDSRGEFIKFFEREEFDKNGISLNAWECMESTSKKGVLRGLHFQNIYEQAKLVRVTLGKVYDVIVDIRPKSTTFKKWQGFYLDDRECGMLYVPRGFARGFYVILEKATVAYILDNKYSSKNESGIVWSDKDLNISWPITGQNDPIMS